MMAKLSVGIKPYAVAYLDNVVVHSSSWEDHYLGFVLGKGAIWPQVGEVDTIMSAERPTRFNGLMTVRSPFKALKTDLCKEPILKSPGF